ncbi:NADH:flavin oxidoreductase/NADH oxidase [Proteus myxofaciens]|uniref:FMN oxidoreductase n=1 Tax=Proteus myxofaciens ATCC 19692 TaxID=1354337 RepID=A0A198GHC3_9GAMM|nr:NADH:flavin oxidoreductase/NADH oxidase [Proteus myxofaciens]OAT36219.1 FMN oxidoreductase [Proteus myxofaciens ATCC 19692]
MSLLFSSKKLGPHQLDNRIIVAPMCQYSAQDGYPTSWHTMHYGQLALSGASLVIIEATAVEPKGRISYKDLGLWSDKHASELKNLVENIKQYSSAKIGIQLAHAGRKASTDLPWKGGNSLAPNDPNGWQSVAPSALAFGENHEPTALTIDEIENIKDAFVQAAKRAESAGIDVIEIHSAHGYLLHEFLSPLSNHRTDLYGGNFNNRSRLLFEVFTAVKSAVSDNVCVGVRISATDWVQGGWDLDSSIALTQHLEELGCDYIHVSSGGLSDKQEITIGPNYQVPFAQAIYNETQLPVIAVGLITEPEQAEAILLTEQADFIALGRGLLYDPRWPWHAAAKLKQTIKVAPQYLRCAPHGSKDFFK